MDSRTFDVEGMKPRLAKLYPGCAFVKFAGFLLTTYISST